MAPEHVPAPRDEGAAGERTALAHVRTALSAVALSAYLARASPGLVVAAVVVGTAAVVVLATGAPSGAARRSSGVLFLNAALHVTAAVAALTMLV